MNAKRRIIGVFGILALLGLGFVSGAIWAKYRLWPYRQLRATSSGAQYNPPPARTVAGHLQIPVSFLPDYHPVLRPDGMTVWKEIYGSHDLSVPVANAALVLVDVWNNGDPPQGQPPSVELANIITLVRRAREAGLLVIHAPNFPVVERYDQYHTLARETELFYEQQGTDIVQTDPYQQFDPDHTVYDRFRTMRSEHRAKAHNPSEPARDISRFVQPLPTEPVVATYAQFRYLLHREGITTLFYTGGALNECMLMRDTGINVLAGMDTRRLPFTIVVLRDCSTALSSPRHDAAMTKDVMLDFYMRKIAFVGQASDLNFLP